MLAEALLLKAALQLFVHLLYAVRERGRNYGEVLRVSKLLQAIQDLGPLHLLSLVECCHAFAVVVYLLLAPLEIGDGEDTPRVLGSLPLESGEVLADGLRVEYLKSSLRADVLLVALHWGIVEAEHRLMCVNLRAALV